MPTVKIALDNRPEGAVVEVPYLGKFKNGTTTEVDERKWKRFVSLWPAASSLEGDQLEVSTAASAEQTAAHRALAEARAAEAGRPLSTVPAGGPGDDDNGAETASEDVAPLSKRTKAELTDLATTAYPDLDVSGKTKDELVALLQEG